MKTLGQRLRELRLSKGFTQSQLAEGIVTPSMVSQIESDKARPSYDVLVMLAERLETPVDELLVKNGLYLELTSEFKFAKASMRTGDYVRAISLLEEISVRNQGRLDQTEVRFDLGCCYLQTGQYTKAEELFKLVEDYASTRKDPMLQARVLFARGQGEAQRKQYQLAVHFFEEAISLLSGKDDGSLWLDAQIRNSLASSLAQSGQLQVAFATYQQALQLYKQFEDLKSLGDLYMKLAETSKALQDLEKSVEYTELALHCYDMLANESEKLQVEMNLAVLLSEVGKDAEAIGKLKETISEFKKIHQVEDAGVCTIELAKVYLHNRQLDLAEEACRSARMLLPSLHLYQGWVCRLLGAISREREQAEYASRLFRQAVDCFKTFDAVRECEGTLQELVALYRQRNDAAAALQVMQELWAYHGKALEQRGIVL